MLTMQTVAANSLKAIETDIPMPAPGQVLIRLHKVGICASDSQIYHGKHKYMQFPLVQGHEGVGSVVSSGEGAKKFKSGDKVTFLAQFACGACHACLKGRENVCVNRRGLGVLEDGLFAEYFCGPEKILALLPDGFPDDKAVLVEPASVGVHAARLAGISPADRAVVLGAGIIGNFTAQACRALGADVIIADIVDSKLEIAKKNGLTKTVNTGREDLEKSVRDLFNGKEATAAFDCAGVEATLNQAIRIAANASRVVIVANFKQPVSMEIPLFQRREVALIPVMAATTEDIRETIRLLHEDKITNRELLSGSFPLRELGAAFDFIDSHAGTTMKVITVM